MSTTQIVATLFQLQQLDLELERLAGEQQAAAKFLQENARIQQLRMEHNAVQQQLHSDLQTQKEAEWTLEELNRRLRIQEQRLYSGLVSNPKELNSLQQEMQHLRAQQSHQEERTLEVMEAAEFLQEEAQRKAEALKQAEEDWSKESAAMMKRCDQLEVRKQEVQAKRVQLVAGMDAEFVSRYDALRRSKQGRAVSKVEQSSCQWCRVILTPSELQRVRISSELQTCSNCGRILYYDR